MIFKSRVFPFLILITIASFAIHIAQQPTPVEADDQQTATRSADDAISYQGYLEYSGIPVDQPCDFRATLHDSQTSAIEYGFADAPAVLVSDGLFLAEFSFWPWPDRTIEGNYMEVSVGCPAGYWQTWEYQTLTPRVKITGAPFTHGIREEVYVIADAMVQNNVSIGFKQDGGVNDGVYVGDDGNGSLPCDPIDETFCPYYWYLMGLVSDGRGAWIQNNHDSASDLYLGAASGSGLGDNGTISSDTRYAGSDLEFVSMDKAWFVLDEDDGVTDAYFGVFHHSAELSDRLFYVNEFGDIRYKGNAAQFTPPSSRTGQSLEMYNLAATENWYEDFGTATLSDGKATVTIDPTFADIANLNEDYHVYLTPRGACSLYVAETTVSSFTIAALDDECAIEFDYRIVAKRIGYESLRMEPAIIAADQGGE